MAEPSGWDIAATIGGIVTIFGSVGAGIRWLFTRHDSREAALDRKEAELVAKLEKRVDALEQETRNLWTVVSYVIPALHAHDPFSPALRMAAKILGNKFPIDFETPEEMAELLKNIP
jgi:hypothetical protein